MTCGAAAVCENTFVDAADINKRLAKGWHSRKSMSVVDIAG